VLSVKPQLSCFSLLTAEQLLSWLSALKLLIGKLDMQANLQDNNLSD
jgi:hypothetical protein